MTTCRRHGTKPTIAFWMLVAVADLALIIASGMTVLLVAFAVVLAGVAGWRIMRRPAVAESSAATPATVRTRPRRRP